MVGSLAQPGACLLSCWRCDLAPAARLAASRKVAGSTAQGGSEPALDGEF